MLVSRCAEFFARCCGRRSMASPSRYSAVSANERAPLVAQEALFPGQTTRLRNARSGLTSVTQRPIEKVAAFNQIVKEINGKLTDQMLYEEGPFRLSGRAQEYEGAVRDFLQRNFEAVQSFIEKNQKDRDTLLSFVKRLYRALFTEEQRAGLSYAGFEGGITSSCSAEQIPELCALLQRVLDHGEKNKMKPETLAIAFPSCVIEIRKMQAQKEN